MERREFINKTLLAGLSVPVLNNSVLKAGPAYTNSSSTSENRGLMKYRFGVNYTPSEYWWYCWSDFNEDSISRDLDVIASLSVDHIRIMLIWTFFQPDPSWVSPVHLKRLDRLLALAGQRNLDVCVSMLVGHLTNQNFKQGYEKGSFFSNPDMLEAEKLYFTEVSKVCTRHSNFMGFDLGNELNCCWSAENSNEGDTWFRMMMDLCENHAPASVHVNGVDHQPWFHPATFSPSVLAKRQKIIALHAWIKYTGALDRGGALGKQSIHLAAAMAALARAYAGDPQKPVWIQEYGASEEWMKVEEIPVFCEKATLSAIKSGANWFTWWASHDIRPKFKVSPLEYSLGLITVDNKIKEQGRVFKSIAEHYRGKNVIIPSSTHDNFQQPPAEYSNEATWKWLEKWIDTHM